MSDYRPDSKSVSLPDSKGNEIEVGLSVGEFIIVDQEVGDSLKTIYIYNHNGRLSVDIATDLDADADAHLEILEDGVLATPGSYQSSYKFSKGVSYSPKPSDFS